MPRLKNRGNLLRQYKEGKLILEQKIWSSENFILYYLSWIYHYWVFLISKYHRDDKFVVISSHPISFFGMTLQRICRPGIRFAYWIGDYFPPVNVSLRLFERLKKYYHDRVDLRYYLSDTISKLFNNGIEQHSQDKQTVMWGVKPVQETNKRVNGLFTILFVGLIKGGQGLELFLSFLAKNPNYKLNIIGICHEELYKKYIALIKNYNLTERVFFPNTFFTDDQLQDLAKTCHVGIALYDLGPNSATYYTDPGKVKTYIELGLPVIMSETSRIKEFIQRFHAGEVVDLTLDRIAFGLETIRKNYQKYQNGVATFNSYFYYKTYYKKRFTSLEIL